MIHAGEKMRFLNTYAQIWKKKILQCRTCSRCSTRELANIVNFLLSLKNKTICCFGGVPQGII